MQKLLKQNIASNNQVIKELKENRKMMAKVSKALDKNKGKKKK